MAELITSEALLGKKTESCVKCLEDKFAGKDGKRHMVVCGGTGCLSSNSKEILEKLENLIKEHKVEDKVTVNMVGCFGLCSQGPFVKIYPEDTLYRAVKVEDCEKIFTSDILNNTVVTELLYEDPVTHEKIQKQKDIAFYAKQQKVVLQSVGMINPEDLNEALGAHGFEGLKNALHMSQQEVVNEILTSGLRGRGGGGFPTGKKWQFALDQQNDEKYVVCNGDEGDPGAFMDEGMLEGNPFQVIEGMMIAGYAIGAKNGYFYVRAEYPIAVNRLNIAIKQLEEVGLLGDNILGTDFSFRVHLRLGAGAFVCGEETALLNSIEGKRGMPRPRPPFPAVKGLFEKPTVLNNVETYANIPQIILKGADWFAGMGTEKSKGTKVFALGGKINNTGLVEVPMGTTLREVVEDIGGGIPNGKKFKAAQTGGPSGGCIPVEHFDVPIDYDNLIAIGSMMGSGGLIVMDEDNCMVDIAKFFLEFTVDESCGKCTPCRIGTKRMYEMLDNITRGKATLEDLDKLEELCYYIKANSLCGLGQTAPNPVLSTLRYFKDEYIAHVVEKRCPAGVCKHLLNFDIDKEKCIGCGMCAKQCPANAITKTDYVAPGHKLPSMAIDNSKCLKCGACMGTCKFKAISKK